MKSKKWFPMDSLNHKFFFSLMNSSSSSLMSYCTLAIGFFFIRILYRLLLYQFFLFHWISFFSHTLPPLLLTEQVKGCSAFIFFSWILLVVFSNSNTVRSLTSTNKIKQLKEYIYIYIYILSSCSLFATKGDLQRKNKKYLKKNNKK